MKMVAHVCPVVVCLLPINKSPSSPSSNIIYLIFHTNITNCFRNINTTLQHSKLTELSYLSLAIFSLEYIYLPFLLETSCPHLVGSSQRSVSTTLLIFSMYFFNNKKLMNAVETKF